MSYTPSTSSVRSEMYPGMFMGSVSRAGGGWSGDLPTSDCEDLENLSASPGPNT